MEGLTCENDEATVSFCTCTDKFEGSTCDSKKVCHLTDLKVKSHINLNIFTNLKYACIHP